MNTSSQESSKSHRSMSDDIGKAAQSYPFNINHYLNEEIHVRVDQISDSNSTLRDADQSHCRTLAVSFQNYSYNNAHGMKSLYVSTTVNPEGVTYTAAQHTVDSLKILKEG